MYQELLGARESSTVRPRGPWKRPAGEKSVGDLTDQGTKKPYGYTPFHLSFLSSHCSIRIAVASSVVSCYITGPCTQPVRVSRYHTLEVCIMYYCTYNTEYKQLGSYARTGLTDASR